MTKSLQSHPEIHNYLEDVALLHGRFNQIISHIAHLLPHISHLGESMPLLPRRFLLAIPSQLGKSE